MARTEHWYKNAIIYAIDVERFIDSNGDGIGDFPGLTNRLDYLASLGITCLWLMPFYPTPNRDNGYDITDYFGVDPRLGSLGDVAEFFREANTRGLRVVLDLVAQHTSNEHPWFQAARRDPDSPYRDYYVWRDQPPEEPQRQQIVFTRHEESRAPWTFDEEAGAYYLHHFYDFEPDLNLQNPAVERELHKVIAFWLQLGAAGFRIDAAPYLGSQMAHKHERPEIAHEIMRRMRDVAAAHRGDAVLIGEVDTEPDLLDDYFGDGHELHMLFNFYMNNFLFLAMARQRAEPIMRAFQTLPSIPATGQWVNWVRNYDELDLERLSDEEREEVMRVFAPEEKMRIYGRGIRRRLPPMVQGDRRRMELAYSLLLSLPGTPCLFIGEEIGMGEDLSLPGRNAVRTPMHWSAQAPNGGFSTASRDKLVQPVIEKGPFNYKQVNVTNERQDLNSFLNWMGRVIWIRRDTPEIGSGRCSFLKTDNECVLAHGYRWEGQSVVVLHNLSDTQCTATVELQDLLGDHPIELLSSDQTAEADAQAGRFEMDPYAYRWYRRDVLR